MSRAIQFQRFGGADVLEIIESEPASPAAGEVAIKTQAVGINWQDVLWRRDMAQTHATLPAGIGCELAGVIEAVGPGVEDYAPGDRVASIPAYDPNRYATYAERATLPVQALIRYPDCLTPLQASVHYVPSLISWLGFREVADLKPGETVLITDACHIGGPYAVQVAKAMGAQVIAATPFEEAIDYLRSLGADAVIHTETQDLGRRIDKLTDGLGVNVVLDVQGGPQLSLLGDLMAPRGRLILYGALSGNQTTFPAKAAFSKNIQFHIHCLSNFSGKPELGIPQNREALDRGIAAVDRLTREGRLKPQVDRIYPFEEIVEAHRFMEATPCHLGRVAIELA
ncbi:zinc-dependent alcohol dehydrogenase family protein [Salinicola rhizosphaerae]|uniref:Alcohol dehydrogenase n=1 Tax=Salinicola rhizosphaerae TaxID=1443141 RepID=A0ABQ3E3J6_9GAMM|nr:zinc-dependent alcohol dehydrogenase family protein [Salinicola rhizosphaerae]GHB24681.1 alcohol dehydrogenase [Salinicola rhizosphaerae]